MQVRSRISFQDKGLVERGFTLIELLVVIVILGILAAVVVFAVSGITNKGNKSACEIETRTVNTAVQSYYAQNNAWPAGPSATQLFTQLNSAGLLQQSAPGATASYTPSYDTTSHEFSASCPS
jgi:prepilin-type N-terminal cleavage/methylation domain-containing protein